MIPVTAKIALDEGEIAEFFVRASGPGGQNVNKVASAVQLRFDARRSPSLPADVRSLDEGVPGDATLANGAKQGKNDFGKIGYGGPCPPGGSAHHYHFKLYALADQVRLNPGATKQQLLDVMKGHILGQTELVGTFKR